MIKIIHILQILDTPDRLRDTLIHEMCHAAAWLINDVSDGHGAFWTAWYDGIFYSLKFEKIYN